MAEIDNIYEKITKLEVDFLKPDDVKEVIGVAINYIKEVKGEELSDRSCLAYIRQIIVGHEWLKKLATDIEILEKTRLGVFLDNMKNTHNRSDNYKAKVMQTIIDFCEWQNGMKAYKSKLFKSPKKKVEKKLLKTVLKRETNEEDDIPVGGNVSELVEEGPDKGLKRTKTTRKRALEEDTEEEESCNPKKKK